MLGGAGGAGHVGFSHASTYDAGTVGLALRAFVSVKNAPYNAKGDEVTDDTAAIQAAIDNLEALGGGTLYFPEGTYLLGSTLTIITGSVELLGAGPDATILKASHSAGAVLQVGYLNCVVRRLTIGATTARKNGAAGQNCAILDMAPDTAGLEVNSVLYDQLYVRDQPWHGMVFVSHYKGSEVTRCRIFDCKGHGIYGEDGTSYSRTNKSQVGGVEVNHTRIFRCDGHAIAVGTVGTAGYRWAIDNVDSFHVALTAGVRASLNNMHLVCENVEVTRCGIGGFSGESGSRTLTTGGVHANGRNARIINNRYIDVLDWAVDLGANSDGAVVEELHVTGEVIAALDPAVVVASGATDVFCRNGFNANITSLMTAAPDNSGNLSLSGGLWRTGYRSSNNELSIADDAVATISFTGITRGIMVLNGNSSTAKAVMVAFRVGDGSAYCTLLTTVTTNVATTTGVLTGTTGVDGDLTISAATASNVIYVENRRGAAGAYMPTFLSIANGELVTP